MDNYTFVPSAPISHNVELYTARFLVQGSVSGPFARTSDLLNHRESRFVKVDQAILTPIGQQTELRKMITPLMVNKSHLHLVAISPQPPDTQNLDSQILATGNLSRQLHVQKESHHCYALTDTFIIQGECHLRRDTDLQAFLERGDDFFPITNPTITLLDRSNATWRRELVLVNREQLEGMYLVEA